MASGTITSTKTSSTLNYIETKIEWTSSADYNANTSDVTAKLYVRKGHHDMTLTIPTSGTWSYSLILNGVGATTNYKSMSVLEGWVLVTQATVSGIAHNNDGTKSITISSSVRGPTGTTLAGHNSTISKTVSLDTIPRATEVNSVKCSTSYLDGVITITYSPKNATHYNKQVVYLNHGGALRTIRATNLGQKSAATQTSSVLFSETELSSIYAVVTKSTSARLRIAFNTYSDSACTKKVGETKFQEISLTIPTSVKPTASLSAAAVNTNSWVKSKGLFVAGYSQVKLTLTAKPGEGASLSSQTISGDDFAQSGTSVTASIASAGTFKFIGKAVDSRGRSASDDVSITALPYSPPAVASISVERGEYTSEWEARENGPDIRVVFKVGLSLVDNGNTYDATFTLDGSARTPNGGATTGLASGANRAVYFLDLDSEASHTLNFIFTDKVGSVTKASIIVPTENVTIEFNRSGKGIAFGKTSEKDAFECAMDAEFSGSVKRIRSDGSEVILDDTGWIDLGISDSVTESSSTTAGHYNGCAYRVVGGNHVYVAFNVRATYSGSAVTVSGTAIPSQYRPKLQPYAVVTLNGSRVARILVSRSNGHAIIDWIRNVSDDVEPAEHIATWIDGYIDYWLN